MLNRMPNPDWRLVADYVQTRSPRQCRERWRMYLHPVVNTGPWTDEEDIILEREHGLLGPQWAAIALFLPGRSEVHVKNRWSKLSRERGKSPRRKTKTDTARQPPKQTRPQLPSISQLCPDSSLWSGLRQSEFGLEDVGSWAMPGRNAGALPVFATGTTAGPNRE
jgi:hypothetical protein